MSKNIATPAPAMKPAGELFTDEQAAAFLSVEPRTLRLWRQTRALPFCRLTPKVIRYRRADLDAWLDRSRTVISPR